MYELHDNNVEHNFVIRTLKDGKFEDGPKSLSKDINYTFVNNGFFNLVLWPMFPLMVFGQLIYFYGMYLIYVNSLWGTLITTSIFALYGGLGQTAGTHRLWSHKCYSAKLPLRIFLAIGHTVGGQYSIFVWSLVHRVHHKYSDTDADPNNVERGFTFSHVGLWLRKEHPLVGIKAKQVKSDDLWKDPVVKFQYDYFWPLWILFSFIIPAAVPMYLFGESLFNAVLIGIIMRWGFHTHNVGFVNSVAHMFGSRPYSDKIASADNVAVAIGGLGEGYHNYHHAYPFDYATGETGNRFNFTKKFIDVMAFFGQAYDLKTASKQLVKKCKDNVKNNTRKSTHG